VSRPPSTGPTERELEILQTLWQLGPARLSDICAALRQQRPVATTTVATMLKVMQGKKLVTRHKAGGGARWAARQGRDATARALVRDMVDRVFDGSARKLVSHLVDHGHLSEADRRTIRQLLRNRGKPGASERG